VAWTINPVTNLGGGWQPLSPCGGSGTGIGDRRDGSPFWENDHRESELFFACQYRLYSISHSIPQINYQRTSGLSPSYAIFSRFNDDWKTTPSNYLHKQLDVTSAS